ncbi:MAG: phosphoribosylglycinamide formyltransferase [Opitutales bacterium]|nr:phosphoribosylglycinamide formyltransferase [Opitutales bacterium]
MKILILASGRGSNAKAIIEGVKSGQIPNSEVCALVSDHADAPALGVAASLGVKSVYLDPQRKGARFSNEGECLYLENFSFYSADLIVLAGFMRIFSPEMIRPYERRIINLHPSLLPKYKGIDAIGQTWNSGDRFGGCTVHFVSAELDGGEIIANAKVERLPGDTLESFTEKIHAAEHKLLPGVVRKIALGEIEIG